VHAKEPEMINDERHEDIGGDRETRERAGPDLVDEQKSGNDREGANYTAERRPTKACSRSPRSSASGGAGKAIGGRAKR
jgi:hypothetical protein